MVSDIEILIEHYIYDEIKNFFETEEKDKEQHILNRWIQTFQNDKNALSIILEVFEVKAFTDSITLTRDFNPECLSKKEFEVWDEIKQNLSSEYRWDKHKKLMNEIKEMEKQIEKNFKNLENK
tara:strand:- start:861 stop:1229 length:369 start_codon:yes stop_codon:yes gene_type:complete